MKSHLTVMTKLSLILRSQSPQIAKVCKGVAEVKVHVPELGGEEVAEATVEEVGEELLNAVEIYRIYQHHVNPLQLQIQDLHFPRSSSLSVTQDHTFHLT